MDINATLIESIILQLPNYVFVKDTNCTYRFCNLNFAKAIGANHPKNIVGKTDYDMPWGGYTADIYLEEDRLILKTGKSIPNKEVIMETPQGKKILSISKAPLYQDSKIIGILGIYVDITADKEKNDEKIRVLQLLAGAIAHELRTPLAILLATGATLKKALQSLSKGYTLAVENELMDSEIPDIKFKYLESIPEIIKKEITDCNDFISSVLGNVKQIAMDRRDLESLSIRDIVNRAIERFEFENHDRELIHLDIKEDFQFKGIPIFMEHVCFNLLKNSLHFIHEAKKGEIFIWTEISSDWNVLHFKDTGPGMEEIIVKSLFDRGFISKREGGTGVGLGFCKQVMLQCGGEINCTSVKNNFTHFTLKFPKDQLGG